MADYFEDCLDMRGYTEHKMISEIAKEVSNWLLGEVNRIMNASNTDINEFRGKVEPEQLRELIAYSHNLINTAAAKSVLEEMFNTGKSATSIITQRGLTQVSDTQQLGEVVSQVITGNTQALADYKAGKTPALKFLVGQVMKATKGRANPKLVNELLKKRLTNEN